MIIYGDPQFETKTRQLLHQLEQRLAAVDPNNLDALRGLLIASGQFEQAVADRLPESARTGEANVQAATDLAAAAFYAALTRCSIGLPAPLLSVESALDSMTDELSWLRDLEDVSLIVKVPEGFEFYNLFPEQYCAAAVQWLEKNPLPISNRTALVAGIRSIGTSLSALVMVILSRAGWQAERFTVRPTGHPFERTVDLENSQRFRQSCALIVDEGPGISGSSMAATAKALAEAGFEPSRIAFLPGHGGEPGTAASPEIRSWWASTARHVCPPETLRWNGLSLAESLAAATATLCQSEEPNPRLEDVGAGEWRRKLYANETEWPAAYFLFERAKYLATPRNGTPILWKFVGLGSLGEDFQWFGKPVASEGSHFESTDQPTPLGYSHGFVALPWICGQALSAGDAGDPRLIDRIARQIIAAGQPQLPATEQANAVGRLEWMLWINVKEAFDRATEQRFKTRLPTARNLPPGPSHGDGRLAPHNWIRTPQGRIFKTGSQGNRREHTVVGQQPLIWDVAGAIVEWNMTSTSVRQLQLAFTPPIEPEALTFYQAAYAAFQMGQANFCANLCKDNPPERNRLKKAETFYREHLLRQLKSMA